MVRIRKRPLGKSIVLLEFKTQYELAATFMRFQEHYDSQRFCDRAFSLEEYMDWYAKQNGKFTYYEDWDGFNIPSSALEAFRAGEFDPLLEKENQLLKLFEDEVGEFYIIGLTEAAMRSDKTGIKHELAHAIFHTDPNYKREVLACLRSYDTSKLRRRLAEMGYARRVLTDEIHAYVLFDTNVLTKRLKLQMAPLRSELQILYRRYSQGLAENL
jgi:hypothetical protein